MSFTSPTSLYKRLTNEGTIRNKGRALDLGCGKGLDALTYSQDGFIVDAVDINKDALDALLTKNHAIKIHLSDIANYTIQENNYDLISASYSLQFLSKNDSTKAIKSIVTGLRENGVALFTLIGPHDDWANNGTWSIWSKEEIYQLLNDLPVEIRNFYEENGKGDTISKGIKNWHVFTFVLTKN